MTKSALWEMTVEGGKEAGLVMYGFRPLRRDGRVSSAASEARVEAGVAEVEDAVCVSCLGCLGFGARSSETVSIDNC